MPILAEVLCPHCGAVLKSNRSLAVGTQVNCHRCSAPFPISARDLAAAGGPPVAAVSSDSFVASATPAAGIPEGSTPRLGLLEPGRTKSAKVILPATPLPGMLVPPRTVA